MTTPETTPSPEPPPPAAGRSQRLSEALTSATLAGLTPEAREALQQARDLLEDRLAAIASGTFAISSWTDEDGDILSLRLWPIQSLSAPPAGTESDPAPDDRWPYPW